MPDSPTAAETIAASLSLFADALLYLDARGIAVELHPFDGCWRYVVGGKVATEGQIVALASLMQPAGAERVQ